MTGWLVDKSAASRAELLPQLEDYAGQLRLCRVGLLEQLYSARSAREYDDLSATLQRRLELVDAPVDLLDQALELQHDLAHHHGLWHRTALPDLFIAVTALHHDLGVLHVDKDFERIAEVRPLRQRRLRLP